MKYALSTFFRLIYRTYFDHKGTAARLTYRRFFVISIFLPIFFLLQLFHYLGFLLDNILFKEYRNIQIKEPLFIIGVPRSGTTYLHKVLAKDTERTTTFTLWELVFAPSIIEKKIFIGLFKLDKWFGNPFSKLISLLGRLFSQPMESIHSLSLTSPEEDYLILAPICACFLLIIPFPFDEIWNLAYFDEKIEEKNKKRIMSFYKSCLQRHLYTWGRDKQLISKNASFVSMIDSIKKYFPDCKIVSTVRSPLKVVPSQLSSILPGTHIFDNDTAHHLFRDRFVDILKHYFKKLITLLPDLPQEDYLFISMEDIKQNLEDVVVNIYHHFHYDLSNSFLQFLHKENERARHYKSAHVYSLEEFELNSETILNDFEFVFEYFGFEIP